MFDVTACYFPITFTPPPNDPHGIKPHMLSHALQAVLTGRYHLPPMVQAASRQAMGPTLLSLSHIAGPSLS